MGICIYPIDQDLVRNRIGARWQIDALAPFPSPREHGAPWGLTRIAYDHPRPPYVYGRARIELGEELPGELPAEPEPETAPRATRAAAPAGEPETQSFALAVSQTPGAGFAAAVSTPAIPWPWQIISVAIHIRDAVANTYSWNVFATDINYSTIALSTTEDPLITPVQAITGPGTGAAFGVLIAHAITGDARQPITAYATGPIGRRVFDPGKKLTWGIVAAAGGVAVAANAAITVQRADGQPAPRTSAPTQRVSAPRPPRAPRPSAPRPVAPPRPPLEAPERARRSTYGHAPGVSHLDDARRAAESLAAQGDDALAAEYADMARRMERGYALTPSQEARLTSPYVYQPIPVSVRVQRPSGVAQATYEQMLRSLSDLG